MEVGATATTSDGNGKSITINVKFTGKSIPIILPADSTVKDLKSLLQPLTNVLPRGQKLIFKGKVLADEMTLAASEVANGAKMMLMTSQGLHQGDGPILREARTRSRERSMQNASKLVDEKQRLSVDKSRYERWKATGVIALSDCNLKVIPNEVWSCETSARVLDLSNNSINRVPSQVGSLRKLQKLLLNVNEISDESISWDGFAFLKHLAVLSLSHNLLTTLPSALGSLTSLKQLHVNNNKLTSLPDEIKFLTRLEVLKVGHNRISIVPSTIGECSSLTEVDLSSNLLSELPETLGCLLNLKALHLNHNGLTSLPSTLFKMCIQLSTLDLHNTEITIDLLRQYEGWEAFDERRRLKHQKQLDFRVMNQADFDEGADKH
ncbi:LRR repeats and ubiquitin-like domain-containing protein [Cucumis melo var. makuwa]|uniref:LRR repeats and ubiquitin-like domain-containing protein At2g30105 n=2 Tax=Cucumis melo TaxID=3656 RepID=A0A1S3CPZ3_CUCME|nr:LRR repeats and ubiquitin-like domain-containing protein At2g30105 [Cucumis melo]KAA0067328.1 LRR repeats and ubiquitin-like domain-containing protein [Cucumis melo var. makuwa]TYK08989.1 LRR repeats and ubiquitin-like domain-containing protein [Cucumis melo var. makuwa]